MLESPKICENLFFAVTIISIFTCTIRSDYNFAMGLLCYYLIKNSQKSKIAENAFTVSTPTLNYFRWSVLTYSLLLWTLSGALLCRLYGKANPQKTPKTGLHLAELEALLCSYHTLTFLLKPLHVCSLALFGKVEQLQKLLSPP